MAKGRRASDAQWQANYNHKIESERRRLEKILAKEGLAAGETHCRCCEGTGEVFKDGLGRRKRATVRPHNKNQRQHHMCPTGSLFARGVDWSRLGIYATHSVRCINCKGTGLSPKRHVAELLQVLVNESAPHP